VSKSVKKVRGEHCINIFVSYQLKERIQKLAQKYDRTMADIVRTLIKVGIPVMEGVTEAQEKLLNDYVKVIRRLRKIKEMILNEFRIPQKIFYFFSLTKAL